MRKFAIAFLACSGISAHAYECTETLFIPSKPVVESKLELKPEKDKPHRFSTEKDGYRFEILQNETDPEQIEKLIVIETATNREAATSFVGWKALKPGTPVMVAYLEGDIHHRKGARMICSIK